MLTNVGQGDRFSLLREVPILVESQGTKMVLQSLVTWLRPKGQGPKGQ